MPRYCIRAAPVIRTGKCCHAVLVRVAAFPPPVAGRRPGWAFSKSASIRRACCCASAASLTAPAPMSRTLASRTSVNSLSASRLVWSSMGRSVQGICWRHGITSRDAFRYRRHFVPRFPRAHRDRLARRRVHAIDGPLSTGLPPEANHACRVTPAPDPARPARHTAGRSRAPPRPCAPAAPGRQAQKPRAAATPEHRSP